jgi:GT2 family glycosyltransferase
MRKSEPAEGPHPEAHLMNADASTKERSPALVSVLLPTLNAGDTLEPQLEALIRQTYEGRWELLIGDNGSTDNTLDVVHAFEDRIPELRILDVPERGKANALNACLAEARGDLLVCCDADDIVALEWMEALVEAARDCELVGGFCEVSRLNDPTVRKWRRPFPADGLPNIFRSKDFAVGCNFAVWRDVAQTVNGWNTGYEGIGEDVDFCLRVQFAGYRICFAPSAVVHYRYRTTIGETMKQAYNYGLTEPQIYKAFRTQGLERPHLLRSLLVWTFLLATFPFVAINKGKRGEWLSLIAFRWGRALGSAKVRTLVL